MSAAPSGTRTPVRCFQANAGLCAAMNVRNASRYSS